MDHITQLAIDRTVFDIGVVEHFCELAPMGILLHQYVAKDASSCLGIDILATEVGQLRERGFNIKHPDITASALNQKFELIIVGDVVENLNNPSALFKNTSMMLVKNGCLLNSSPNSWYDNAVFKNV